MTVDLSQVREDHGMVQAHAETVAAERIQGRYGDVSFRQGHRTGWRDAIEWAVRASGPIHWDHRVVEVWGRLLIAGVARTGRDIDLAIDSARDALAADTGTHPDPDSTHGWEVLEPHVLRFLDLTDAELAAVA